MADLETLFKGARVPAWLQRFQARPVEAVGDLLIGRADLELLSADEPALVLLDWLDALGERNGFAGEVDRALANWIDAVWGIPALPRASHSASLTAVAWCRLADVISMDGRLRESADRLRARVLGDCRFLDALREGRTRDPLGRAWLALAAHQHDRALIEEWWRLCMLPPDEPWYRGACGIHGLRGLPQPEDSRGGFPVEVAEGLSRLAYSLRRREDEGWLAETTAEDEFLRTARMTMAAYPFPKKWNAFWQHALRHGKDRPPEDWIHKLPGVAKTAPKSRARDQWTEPPADWSGQAQAIAVRLRRQDPSAVTAASALLQAQASYAEQTGNVYFIVRSSCNLARQVRDTHPDLALQWSEMAREWDPWNEFAWTTTASVLLKLHRIPEALRVAVEAVDRFPQDVVARTGLAEVLKAQGRLPEAEAVYRETADRFPQNVVARNGLAEVLKAQGRLPEAETVYREALRIDPLNQYAQSGLDRVLRLLSGMPEAESGPIDGGADLGNADAVDQPPTDLSDWERPAASEASEPAAVSTATPSAELTVDARDLRSHDVAILLTDVHMLRRWARRSGMSVDSEAARAKAMDLLNRLRERGHQDSWAAGEAGLLGISHGDLEAAIALLREARQRFPGSLQVRYALARAEREAARRYERRLDAAAEREVISPWRQITRLDERCRPVQWLGEGRAWLSLLDGATVEGKARDNFGRLAYWVREQLEPLAGRLPEHPSRLQQAGFQLREGADPFFAWWAGEVQVELFGADSAARAEDLGNLDELRSRIDAKSGDLDQIEEECVRRLGRV